MTATGSSKGIDEIWYCFSKNPSEDGFICWKRAFCNEFRGKILPAPSDGEKLKAYFGQSKKNGRQIFFISDSTKLCKAAEECGVPFLLYVDSDWEDCSFSGVTYCVEELSVITPEFIEQVYRRFMHKPWDILETERCLVRETTEEDIDALYEMYREPSITLYTEKLYEDKEKERTYIRDYIKNIYEFYGFGVWTVVLKETGELIGRAGLTYREGFDTPELGYVIAVPFQRQGIATEVCAAILQYGFEVLNFRQIRVLFEPENTASERLCQKLGFQKDSMQLVNGLQMQQYIIQNI